MKSSAPLKKSLIFVLLVVFLSGSASAVPAGFRFGGSGGTPVFLDVTTNLGLVSLGTDQSVFDVGIRNQGWWSDISNASDTNDNYIVGNLGGAFFRDFFTFDVNPLIGQTVLSADLRFPLTGSSTGPSEFYTLYDVSTDAAALNNNVGTNASIFDDLGTGTILGGSYLLANPNPQPLTLALNSAGLAALNSTIGSEQFFSLGGRLDNVAAASSVPEIGVGSAGLPLAACLVFLVLISEERRKALGRSGIVG